MDAPLEEDRGIVLGIDPGTIVVGYGAVRRSSSASGRSLLRAEYVEAGVLRARRSRPLAERLGVIAEHLEQLLDEVRPTVVVVERAFAGRNPATALRLGEGRGLALAIAARRGCRVVERTPAEAKRLVAGSGAATKSAVAAAVSSLLRLPMDGVALDATDALALALSEVHRPDASRRTGPRSTDGIARAPGRRVRRTPGPRAAG
ncbi:MAG: crossover junction endodeoxyribonuclease RuvC [Planctomycetota bacterium]